MATHATPPNGRPIIGIGQYRVWNSKRFRGYFGDIEEVDSQNKDTPYKLTTVGMVWFYDVSDP